MNELFELLTKEQKKEVADKIAKKCLEAVDSIDVNDFKDFIEEQFKEILLYAFTESAIDIDKIGDMLTDLIYKAISKCYGGKDEQQKTKAVD